MAILMCRPEYFGIEYEINPWMNIALAVDHDRAIAQWEALHRAYLEHDQTIVLAPPVAGLPDMVFSANAAVVWGRRAVLSRFRHVERAGEEEHWRTALADLGLEVLELPEHTAFEGAGDALFAGDVLFQAFGFRTDRDAHEMVARTLDVESVSLQLIDARFYHLDTCFCPLDERTALVAPQAFTSESLELLRSRIPNLIEVPEAAAHGFACNALLVGSTVVSSTAVAAVREPLAAAGFDVMGLPMTEFLKSGGGVRCLSLPVPAAAG